MEFTIPAHIKQFLIDNWATIDAFEFEVLNQNVVNLLLYEVKTVNFYNNGMNAGKKSFLTRNAAKCYREAQKLGFLVKSVSVVLFDRWNFDVIIKPYKEQYYTIHSGNPRYAKS